MISRLLLKIKQDCVPLLILIAPVWSTQPWYPKLVNLCVREPVLLSQGREILISSKNIVHPLMVENVKDITEYLTLLFNYGNVYRTINFQRSAISAFHENIDGLRAGKHPGFVHLYLVYLIQDRPNQDIWFCGMLKFF